MGLRDVIKNEILSVVEWANFAEDTLFYKWPQSEIKKGSRLIIRPGQAAIFFMNGAIEGRFEEPGDYDIDSEIIPLLSTLKGWKYGFDSAMRAEVLFINTRECVGKWGTQQPILLNVDPATMPGGLPIRANGSYSLRVKDATYIIQNITGLVNKYKVGDYKERIMNAVQPSIMAIISEDGKNMFNLQAKSREIAAKVQEDIADDFEKMGLEITNFTINQVSYPEEVQQRINQNAGLNMIGDVSKLQAVAMADGLSKGGEASMGAMMMGAMGMNFLNQQQQTTSQQNASASPKGAKFCSNCGSPLAEGAKFCSNCGNPVTQ